jgi:hypothetical protein
VLRNGDFVTHAELANVLGEVFRRIEELSARVDQCNARMDRLVAPPPYSVFVPPAATAPIEPATRQNRPTHPLEFDSVEGYSTLPVAKLDAKGRPLYSQGSVTPTSHHTNPCPLCGYFFSAQDLSAHIDNAHDK